MHPISQKKEFIIGKRHENTDTNQFEETACVGDNVNQLQENVKRLKQELAAKYLTDFADLFQRIPVTDKSDPDAVLNWVETWKEYRNISKLDRKTFQTMIGDLETQLDMVKNKEQKYNDLTQRKHALLEEMKREGEKIVDNVESVVLNLFGPSALSANMALANTLRETIDCIKVQVRSSSYLYSIFVEFRNHFTTCIFTYIQANKMGLVI